MGEHASAFVARYLSQAVLGGRQVHLVPVHLHGAALKVELQAIHRITADCRSLALPRRSATRMRARSSPIPNGFVR